MRAWGMMKLTKNTKTAYGLSNKSFKCLQRAVAEENPESYLRMMCPRLDLYQALKALSDLGAYPDAFNSRADSHADEVRRDIAVVSAEVSADHELAAWEAGQEGPTAPRIR